MPADATKDASAQSAGHIHNLNRETSDLACKSCKRRKAKCDRLLPCCTLCERNSQACVYPSIRLRPGPKTGSRQCKRRATKSAAGHESDRSQHAAETSTAESNISATEPDITARENSAMRAQLLKDTNEPWEQHIGFLSPRPTDDNASLSGSSPVSSISDTRFVRAISLSALVHPSHEANLTPPSSVHSPTQRGFFIKFAGAQNTLMQVCESLDMSIDSLQRLTDAYFDNMTSFSLFHQPSFGDKIQNINNALHLKALLAAMFSFSARFAAASTDLGSLSCCETIDSPSHTHLHQLSMNFVNQAIDDYDDEPPPLCILQALILCTFYELTKGVRGRAWRMLGNCVRIAHEQRLHLLDSTVATGPPLTTAALDRWSLLEERRRSWWAIWQMDVFASTVHRLPTAIDDKMIETNLPVPDEMWFQNMYQPSCLLDTNPTERPKKLYRSGNCSETAWFIIINATMRNAQVLARGSLHSALSAMATGEDFDPLKQYFHGAFRRKQSAEDANQLSVLASTLQQTVALLPQSLVYQGTQLGFGSRTSSSTDNGTQQIASERRLHAAQHAIFLMTQLARFMIYHHLAFSEILLGTIFSESGSRPSFGWTATPKSERERLSNSEGLRNCLEASDDIYSIISRSSDIHVRWTNPFLASTVWLAASLQVLRKVFAPSTYDETAADKMLPELRKECQRYTDFWGTPRSLLVNLDSLEERMGQRKRELAVMEAKYVPSCAPYQFEPWDAVTAAHLGGNATQNFDFVFGLSGAASPHAPRSAELPGPVPNLDLRRDRDPKPTSPLATTEHRHWLDGMGHGTEEDNAIANCPTVDMRIPDFNIVDDMSGFIEGDPGLCFGMPNT